MCADNAAFSINSPVQLFYEASKPRVTGTLWEPSSVRKHSSNEFVRDVSTKLPTVVDRSTPVGTQDSATFAV
jgi:hypothetical protein